MGGPLLIYGRDRYDRKPTTRRKKTKVYFGWEIRRTAERGGHEGPFWIKKR